MNIRVCIKLNYDDLPTPEYMTAGSAGLDLYACVTNKLSIEPGKSALVPTGISVEIPEGYEAQIRPRSGLALKWGITLLNSPGTIDSDYRGEIKVIMINHGEKAYTITRGDRIAQMIFCPVVKATFEIVDQLGSSDRGKGGFGHTGY